MKQFLDQKGCHVRITFDDQMFSKEVGHVWVVCRFGDKWLLTQHRTRGIEFPGGKVEKGESALEAAEREVHEETGAQVDSISYIGQYEVSCGEDVMYKNVYFASIAEILKKEDYLETNGPVLLDELPADIQSDKKFSFMMKDQVLPLVLEELIKLQLL
ncbi:RNA deprotection pyrophosphohydrolase [Halalkalibacter nanhaiisediminis]|uniref:8-oxo-dGTP diphosphatase n=1 Tax=Halalkalibacter nanhaiisediminis TaxID=688079 RepID=A0A562QJF5_9BACI|nr:nucleoside triphosphatase YtkD [Halalkalibacter nanhaiisediminis]TWI56887.1 8-oxo-dGTP diphosphatase [Halalkalibacter nanhaiisediminis]